MKEVRIALRNVGHIDPMSIEDYIKAGGYKALKKARKMDRGELIVMIDGAPICLHANYLFSEQFFVSYNSIMAAVELAMNHTPYGFGDRVDSYYQALESSETIASYETSQAAMRSEYRQYFAILEKMLQSL